MLSSQCSLAGPSGGGSYTRIVSNKGLVTGGFTKVVRAGCFAKSSSWAGVTLLFLVGTFSAMLPLRRSELNWEERPKWLSIYTLKSTRM